MNPVRFWFAIFAVLGLVVVAPAWLYFAGDALEGTPLVVNWLVASMFPILGMLTIASWVQTWGG